MHNDSFREIYEPEEATCESSLQHAVTCAIKFEQQTSLSQEDIALITETIKTLKALEPKTDETRTLRAEMIAALENRLKKVGV